MSSYTPCLKLKSNELDALKKLDKDLLEYVLPLFDIPRNLKDGDTTESVFKYATNAIKKLEKWWDKEKEIIIDSYDIPTILDDHGNNIYASLINTFILSGFATIPVVALNRDESHNDSVVLLNQTYGFQKIAIRLDLDDMSDLSLIKDDLSLLINTFPDSSYILILDVRLIKSQADLDAIVDTCTDFLDDLKADRETSIDKIVVTASAISTYIAKPNMEIEIPRYEAELFNKLQLQHEDISYGDYGIIGPDYSDQVIPEHLMPDVSTPKLIYTDNDQFHVFKGGSFKRHERGYEQFHDLAKKVTELNCFRGSPYSEGDKFIDLKSKTNNSPSSQGHWYQNLNIAHISFVLKDFLSIRVSISSI